MNKKESIERMLVLANRLNAIVADLNAKKEAILQASYKKEFIESNIRPILIDVYWFQLFFDSATKENKGSLAYGKAAWLITEKIQDRNLWEPPNATFTNLGLYCNNQMGC